LATKKALKTYTRKMTTAKTAYNKAKSTYTKNEKAVSTLKTKLSKAKTASEKSTIKSKITSANKSVKKSKKKVTKAKTAYTKAKSNLASFKKSQAAEKRKATVKLKKKMITQMQKDKPGYWKAKRPFVIPKYPGTVHSYVFIDNTTESETSTRDMTTNSIAPGQYINHFVQNQPTQRQIDGKLGGSSTSKVPGLKKQYDMLKRWGKNGTEVELHHGQRGSNSAVLTSTGLTFDAPRDNALPVSVSLEDVKWATSEVKKSSKKKTTGKQEAGSGPKSVTQGTRKKSKPKAGKFITIKKGDTYWEYHVSFGTSIAKLRSWNGYPDRKLPIGKKVRVK